MQAQAKVRSMTQRLGWTTKPASVRLMISIFSPNSAPNLMTLPY
jgi:hypothetical protein